MRLLREILRECVRFLQDLLWENSFRCVFFWRRKRSRRALEPTTTLTTAFWELIFEIPVYGARTMREERLRKKRGEKSGRSLNRWVLGVTCP